MTNEMALFSIHVKLDTSSKFLMSSLTDEYKKEQYMHYVQQKAGHMPPAIKHVLKLH